MPTNTLTNLIPNLYEALDVVSRELVGFIPAVTRDSGIERAAVGQTVYSFVAPAAAAGNITPAVTPPDDGEQVIGSVALQITKARRVPLRWKGEETRGLNTGAGFNAVRVAQFAQSMRTLTNEVEADMASLYSTTSRAYGTATTDPFASTLGDPARARQILSDNGAPLGDIHLIINTSAGAAMRTLGQLTKANEAADTTLLRQGILTNIHGFDIRESGQIKRPAIGTSNNAGTTDTAGYAIGSTTITMAAAGTGTILAGDMVTFTGDANKYVVATGIASLAAGGTIVLAAPGLRQAVAASNVTVTVVAISSRNMFFSRNALVLATRLPALPEDGDMAVDRTTIVDDRSGLAFEVAQYAQYRQMQYEISIAWGYGNVKPEHSGILLGA